jgi:hypothetical protein
MLNNEQFVLLCNLVDHELDGGTIAEGWTKRRMGRLTEREVRRVCGLVAKHHPLTREEAIAQGRKIAHEAKANTPEGCRMAAHKGAFLDGGGGSDRVPSNERGA